MKRNFVVSRNIDENLEDRTKNCQTSSVSVKESMWHYSECTIKENVKVK